MFNTNPMKGTTNSNFTLFAVTEQARIGYRPLENGQYRVRVEPTTEQKYSFGLGWTSPADGHNRYSTVVNSWNDALKAMQYAFGVVGLTGSYIQGQGQAAPDSAPDSAVNQTQAPGQPTETVEELSDLSSEELLARMLVKLTALLEVETAILNG